MNTLLNIHPLVLNSLQTSLAVAMLFGIVLLVRRRFARHFGAKAAYALWLVPLARLFMPPLPANMSLFGALAPTEAVPAAPLPVAEPVFIQAPAVAHAPASTVPPPPAIEWTSTTTAVSEPSLLDSMLASLPSLLLPVWITGIVLVLGFAWWRQSVFHRLIEGDSDDASPTVHEMASEIALSLKLRRDFDVRTSLLNGSPLVTGLKRPVVLLPAWFESDYSPREQRDALTHELMHVKRGDLFALQLAQLVLALQWFNPLAHLALRAFRIDQEAACDADVLRAGTSSAFAYGQTLVKAARLAGPADGAFRGANLTLTHPIKERLILMQNTAPTLRKRLLGTTLAVTLGSAALLATASCAASAAPRDQGSSELAGGDSVTRKSKTTYYRISSSNEGEDRQFVLLSDPFEALEPRLKEVENLDLSDLEDEMQKLSIEIQRVVDIDGLKLANIESLAGLAELEGLSELEGLATLADLHIDFDLQGLEDFDVQTIEDESGVKIIIPNQEIFISKFDEDAFELEMEKVEAAAEAYAERAEALAEAHAERAEAMAEAHAERAEKMAMIIESRVEEKADRMEMLGEKMEARIEAAFADGLEDDLEDAGEVIETLADQCNDRDESLTTPVILSTRAKDGTTHRALCVIGTQDQLDAPNVRAFVLDNPTLSDAEKERFEENADYEYEFSWTED